MPGEFKLDPGVDYSGIARGLEEVGRVSTKTAADIQTVTIGLAELAKARAQLKTGDFELIDPKSVRTMEELEKLLLKNGVLQETLNKKVRDETVQLKETAKVLKEIGRTQLYNSTAAATAGMAWNKIKGSAASVAKSFENQARSIKNFATSTAGIELSFIGIIALMVELHNRATKVYGMSQKTGMQWGYNKAGITSTNREIWKLHGQFRQSLEASGELVNSLAKVGFTSKQVNTQYKTGLSYQRDSAKAARIEAVLKGKPAAEAERLRKYAQQASMTQVKTVTKQRGMAEEVMAAEIAYGQSAGEQAKYTKGLVNNFNVSSDAAMNYLEVLREATITAKEGGLVVSIEELTQDWAELIDKTKVYNTNLLGTLALYNTLMRKDVAGKLGFGNVPASVRKEMVKTIAGFSANLSYGWKSKLMEFSPEGKGKSPVGRALAFEKLPVERQFALMAKALPMMTKGMTGENQEVTLRKLLEDLGFGKESQKVMAEAFQGGKFSGDNLQKILTEIQAQRDAAEKAEKDAPKQRAEMVKHASSIAYNMQSVQDAIKQWVEMNLVGYVEEIVGYLKKIAMVLAGPNPITEPGAFLKYSIESGLEEDKAKFSQTDLGKSRAMMAILKGTGAYKEKEAGIFSSQKWAIGEERASSASSAALRSTKALSELGESLSGIDRDKFLQAIKLADQRKIKEATDIIVMLLKEKEQRDKVESRRQVASGLHKSPGR